jgi:hypothetical protein
MRSMTLVIFLLSILFTALQAAAKDSDNCIAYLTPTQSYAALMQKRQLMRQHDERLRKKRLILKNGGLCTSTCGINAVQALLNLGGRQLRKNSASYLHIMLDYLKLLHRVDGRKGLTLTELKEGLYFLAAGLMLPIRINVEPYQDTMQLTPQNDEILIAMLADQESHAVVVLGPHRMTNEIALSDPNSPNRLKSAPFSTFEYYVKEIMRIRRVTSLSL